MKAPLIQTRKFHNETEQKQIAPPKNAAPKNSEPNIYGNAQQNVLPQMRHQNKIETTPRHQQKHHHIASPKAPSKKNMCTYTYIHIKTHIKTIRFPFFKNPTGAQNKTAPTYAIFF